MSERDFYPAGEQAPGIQGDFKDWIPGPVAKSNVPEPTVTEAEATQEAVASMDGAIPYKPLDDPMPRAFRPKAKE